MTKNSTKHIFETETIPLKVTVYEYCYWITKREKKNFIFFFQLPRNCNTLFPLSEGTVVGVLQASQTRGLYSNRFLCPFLPQPYGFTAR